MCAISDIRCAALVSEVVPCADFMFNVSIESGLNCLIASVRLHCLLLCLTVMLNFFMAASMLV